MYVCVYDGTVHASVLARNKHKKSNKYYRQPYDKQVVLDIIKDYMAGYRGLTKKYGVDRNTIKKIITSNGYSWRTLEETNLLRYGVQYTSQQDHIKSRVSDTIRSKTQNEKVLIELKKQSTCMMNHGVTHAQKCSSINAITIQAQQKTLLERYGVDHPCKIKEVQERSEITRQSTMMEKYGVRSPAQLPTIKQKIMNTNIERYGVKWQVLRDDFNRFQLYSSIHKTVYDYLIANNIEAINEYRIGIYCYDIYIDNINLLIEINGDYWHCNPLMYNSDFTIGNMCAQNIWDKDKRKQLLALNKGYDTLTIWENQVNDHSYINILKTHIKELQNG